MVAEGLVKVDKAERDAPQIPVRQAESGADVIDMQAFVKDAGASQKAAHG